jgi:hypothetical protein
MGERILFRAGIQRLGSKESGFFYRYPDTAETVRFGISTSGTAAGPCTGTRTNAGPGACPCSLLRRRRSFLRR